MVVRPRKPVYKAWLPQHEAGFGLILGLIAALGGGCDRKPSTPHQMEKPAAVTGIATAFEDEVKPLPGNQVLWSTYWKFCWEAYPGAGSYELQIITPEGASPRLKSRKEPCYRIQVATGVNPAVQGMPDRDKLIGLQTGQLSYRVRAVLGDNQYSEWSPVITMKPIGKREREFSN